MEIFVTSNISAISGISPPSSAPRSPRASPDAAGHTSASNNTHSDQVQLSPEARSRGESSQHASQQTSQTNPDSELTPEEQKQLQELKARDREVRMHEQAHLSAAGQYAAGGPSFTYQQGPDGNRYAIGGEVPIDISKESTPAATIQKMQVVRQAALAPAEPSSADRQIAAQAAILATQARQELAMEELQGDQSRLVQSSENNPSNGTEDIQSAQPNRNSASPQLYGGFSAAAVIQAYTTVQNLGS